AKVRAPRASWATGRKTALLGSRSGSAGAAGTNDGRSASMAGGGALAVAGRAGVGGEETDASEIAMGAIGEWRTRGLGRSVVGAVDARASPTTAGRKALGGGVGVWSWESSMPTGAIAGRDDRRSGGGSKSATKARRVPSVSFRIPSARARKA